MVLEGIAHIGNISQANQILTESNIGTYVIVRQLLFVIQFHILVNLWKVTKMKLKLGEKWSKRCLQGFMVLIE